MAKGVLNNATKNSDIKTSLHYESKKIPTIPKIQ